MELTDMELEKIRTVARGVDYGSIIIHIAGDAPKIDMEVNNRIRLERKPARHSVPYGSELPDPMPRRGGKGYRD